jgi:hypothetical protein
MFQFSEPIGEVLVGGEEFSHANEGSHDHDVGLDGSFAIEYRGEHGDALLFKITNL